ncbi:hypothetical protein SpCBS45565_g03778 [Spizellomyces sp. 'palustris']|nr:hypothetical protein SpCBS45565_g03778 [Spizellomyces sp. 'palustris']
MVNKVDDPHCQYNEDGTITYTGQMQTWDDPIWACMGINLYSMNVGIAIVGIIFNIILLRTIYKFLFSWRKTFYNTIMLICPVALLGGHFVDLISSMTWFHSWGYPNLGHFGKVFFYAMA